MTDLPMKIWIDDCNVFNTKPDDMEGVAEYTHTEKLKQDLERMRKAFKYNEGEITRERNAGHNAAIDRAIELLEAKSDQPLD